MVKIKKSDVSITIQRNTIGNFGRIQIASKELLEHVGKRAEVTINIID